MIGIRRLYGSIRPPEPDAGLIPFCSARQARSLAINGRGWAFALIFCLAACSPTPPDGAGTGPRYLTGLWGGDEVEVHDSTTTNGVVLRTACQVAFFPGPVVVDSTGAFSANGVDIASSWRELVGQSTTVSGRISGDSLTISVAFPEGDGTLTEPMPFALQRGNHETMHQVYCPD